MFSPMETGGELKAKGAPSDPSTGKLRSESIGSDFIHPHLHVLRQLTQSVGHASFGGPHHKYVSRGEGGPSFRVSGETFRVGEGRSCVSDWCRDFVRSDLAGMS